MGLEILENQGEAVDDSLPAVGSRRSRKPNADLRCATVIRILLLDADFDMSERVQSALQGHGVSVTSVTEQGRENLYLSNSDEEPFHLVIVDEAFSPLGPEHLISQIAAAYREASILVTSKRANLDTALRCLRAGAKDFVAKPFQESELRQVLTRCLENHGLLRLAEEALRESLGSSIRDRRKSLGLTLSQLAHRTGISLGYLSQIELGKNSASIETLYRICLALGLRLSKLFESVSPSV